MKRLFAVFLTFGALLSLSGCTSKPSLRYEECIFNREEHYENWVVESYEGVTAEIVSVSSDALTVTLHNGLDHDIEFQSWSRACVYQNSVWYTVLPPKDIASADAAIEKTPDEVAADTVSPNASKDFTINFPESYQGESLPSGNYRISLTFQFVSPRDPQRTEHEKVWIDFVVD